MNRVWRVDVMVRDGDDWTAPGHAMVCDVEADSERDATLAAMLLAMTPLRGMPTHMQITTTTPRR